MKPLEYFFHCKEDPMWMRCLVSLVVYDTVLRRHLITAHSLARTLETLDAPFMLIQVYH